MKRFVFWVVCAAVLSPLVARAQKSDQAEEKGTYLGVLFGPVRDGPGVVVTHVLPDSPAAKSKVNRDDLILQYDKTKVTDCEHFARLISADKPDRTVKLLVQRDGAQRTVEVTLTTGPVLRIGKTNPAGTSKTTDDSSPKGTAKPTAPASVSVTALPLGENRIRLTIEYYKEGRLQTAECSGEPNEIEREVNKLPNRVQALAKTALVRIRDLNLQTTPPNDKTPTDPKR